MDESELVRRFVAATQKLSTRKAGALIRVSHSTIADWRRGEIGAVQPNTLRAIEGYFGRKESDSGGAEEPASRVAEPRSAYAGERSIFQRLDEIESLDVSEVVKIHKIDAIAGLVRAEAAFFAERAQYERALALKEDGAGATLRGRQLSVPTALLEQLSGEGLEALLDVLQQAQPPSPPQPTRAAKRAAAEDSPRT